MPIFSFFATLRGMDAHLFRRIASSLVSKLHYCRIDSIAALANNTVQFRLYGQEGKFALLVHTSRDKAAIMLSKEALSPKAFGFEKPPAFIMRLRKYAGKQRIRQVHYNFLERRLYLLIDNEKSYCLCIDMQKGVEIHEYIPENYSFDAQLSLDDENSPWPSEESLASLNSAGSEDRETSEANEELWRAYPVLTPSLRRTLKELEPLDQQALLIDLQEGGGDVFLLSDKDGPCALSAWPLPEALCKGKEQEGFEDVFVALHLYGKKHLLDALNKEQESEAKKQYSKERKSLQRLVKNLEKDHERLLAMQAQQEIALRLQAWLHTLPANEKHASLLVPSLEGEEGDVIKLRQDLTVRENMQALFHTALRGKRGLPHAQRRYEEALEKLRLLEQRPRQEALHPLTKQGKATEQKTKHSGKKKANSKSAKGEFPKNIQVFQTDDGFTLWRGRDAKGNLAALRLAAPHDLWVHVQEGPSAHVIIRRNHLEHQPSEKALDEAARLCVEKSSYAFDGNTENSRGQIGIMTALVRHVRPRKGAAGKVDIQKIHSTRMF